MNLRKSEIILPRSSRLKTALIIMIVAFGSFFVGADDGFRRGYRVGTASGQASVPAAERVVTLPDAPYERIIVQKDVKRIVLRNLGDGKSRTIDFSRPITVVRTMCDDDGLLLECVQWTLPGAQSIKREIVWDMDVVSFVTVDAH